MMMMLPAGGHLVERFLQVTQVGAVSRLRPKLSVSLSVFLLKRGVWCVCLSTCAATVCDFSFSSSSAKEAEYELSASSSSKLALCAAALLARGLPSMSPLSAKLSSIDTLVSTSGNRLK